MAYDVVIIGGGTAGCAAAYISGLNGLKTLLIEKNIHLGGMMTSGLVTPCMKTSDNAINTMFFEDFMKELANMHGQIKYIDNNVGWFNPELAKIALDNLMQKANVEVLFDTTIKDVTIENNKITSLNTFSNMLSVCIGAKYVIDATGNCEIFKLSNCNFLNNENKSQPTTLRFIMSGIDLKTFSDWLLEIDNDREVTTVGKIDNQIHLSTAYTWDTNKNWALKPYFDDAVVKNILKDTDRNYFQVFTIPNMPNSIAFNCPRIVLDNNIDVLDNKVISKTLIEGRSSILRLAEFCKKYLKGFENAYISNIADMLGIRVSRRITGKYIYTTDDLKTGKKFENPVVVSNYPIDIHSSQKDNSVLEHTMQEYQLPIESLMSNEIDNLFAVGRCISADFESQAALRIQPSCFSMGEGVAKYITKLVKN